MVGWRGPSKGAPGLWEDQLARNFHFSLSLPLKVAAKLPLAFPGECLR